MTNLQYGLLIINRDGDEWVIEKADPIVALSFGMVIELVASGAMTVAPCDEVMVAGQLRYRPIAVDSSRLLVLQRQDG